jgi:hypothetical protein
MLQFTTIIKQFGEKGEKTGWTYIEIPEVITQQLMPGNKKAFRVKGFLDEYPFQGIGLIPMGGGDFIMALNATIRKVIKKRKGARLQVQMEVDKNEIKPPVALIECLSDEPAALAFYNSLSKSHQHYFTNWINSAKTEPTKTKRIAQSVTALSKGFHFAEMLRSLKKREV